MLISELQPEDLRKLVKAPDSLARKAEMTRRLKVWRENYKDLVLERIQQVYTDPDFRKNIAKHISLRRNTLRQIINVVAIAYDNQPTRYLPSLDPEKSKQFSELYNEIEWAEKSEETLKLTHLMNVVHLVPYLENNGELSVRSVLPNTADVIFGEDEETPDILIWQVYGKKAAYCAVDSVEWVWFDKDFKVVSRDAHGMGVRPWVAVRVKTPPDVDYWDRHAGNSLLEGTVDISRIQAQMGWVRKTNSKNLLYLFVGLSDEVPNNQRLNGENPLFARSEGVDAKLDTVENIVSVDEFVKEIKDIIETLAESYGVPLSEVDPDARASADSTNIFGQAQNNAYSKLAKVRNRQIKFLESVERKLSYRLALLDNQRGRAWDAPKIKEDLRVNFPPLTANDHPKGQVETAEALMRVGATDQFSFYQTQHPNLTQEESKVAVLNHMRNRNIYNEILITRNMPNDPTADSMNLAQAQGRVGGLVGAMEKATDTEAKKELKKIEGINSSSIDLID